MQPELSVILVVGERRDRVVPALASVLAQDVIERLEILLLDLGAGDPLPVPGSDHPAVRRIKLPPDTLFSSAKARAIRMASAPVVVFLEEHCRTHPGWAQALIEAHRGPWAGVGAEVHNGNPEVGLSRTIQVLNYLWWLPPAPRAEFDMLPGHNSSFKRDLLLAYGDELEELLRAEIVLHSRLRRDGHRLLLEPAAKFSHINESSLGSAFRGRFLFNRCYGPARAKAFGWSLGRRLFYAAALPVFPFYTLTRLLQYAVRRRPERLGRVIAGTPLLLAVQLASAAGHSLGLLFGTGDAEARFSRFEMNEYRRHQG